MKSKALENFKGLLGSHELFSFHGPFSPLMTCIPWAHEKESPVYLPMPLLFMNKGRDTKILSDNDNYRGTARETFRQYAEGKISLESLKNVFDKTFNEAKKLHDLVFGSDIKKWDDERLKDAIAGCGGLWHLVARTLYMETFDKEIAESALSGEMLRSLSNVWDDAVSPDFVSFEIRRKQQARDIVQRFGTGPEAARQASFIFLDYFSAKTNEEVMAKLREVDGEDNDAVVAPNSSADISRFSVNERKLCDYIKFVIEKRDLRKDPIAWSQAVIAEVGAEMAARAGLGQDTVPFISSLEYRNGVDWLRENRDLLSSGKNGTVILVKDDGTIEKEYIDPAAIEREIESLTGAVKDVSELRGQGASKGKYRGTVRVVIDPLSPAAADFREGDILVTSMTRPEFVPLMKRSGAVVTNEGGITCHAAIISRELGIPCVIGTKIATKVLKDGDEIEVDAEKGIVRVLKKI